VGKHFENNLPPATSQIAGAAADLTQKIRLINEPISVAGNDLQTCLPAVAMYHHGERAKAAVVSFQIDARLYRNTFVGADTEAGAADILTYYFFALKRLGLLIAKMKRHRQLYAPLMACLGIIILFKCLTVNHCFSPVC
jgi:hypothetical protein